MSDPGLTAPQRRALEKIAEGRVKRYYGPRGHQWATGSRVRGVVVERVIGMKLAKLGPIKQPGLVATVELTDAGREAISDAR